MNDGVNEGHSDDIKGKHLLKWPMIPDDTCVPSLLD